MTSGTAVRVVLRRTAQVVVTVVLLGFLGWSVAGRWDEVRGVLGDLSAGGLVLAGLAATVAYGCGFLSWRVLLTDLGAPVPVTGAARIFFVGQLAKYLPGKVWPILFQARLGRAYQVPGRTSAAAGLLALLVTLGTGLLVTVGLLPALGDRAFDRFWWTVLVLPAALVALWPPLLNRLFARLLRLARREPLPRPLTGRGIGPAVGWSVAGWLAYGVHLWLLLRDAGATGATLPLVAVGAFAGSWCLGFLLAVAPAGVGAREVAVPLLLAGSVAAPVALVAAVVSRLLMTVVDLLCPLCAVLTERVRSGHPVGGPAGRPGPPAEKAPSAGRTPVLPDC
ncbi:lysylphosphatidylglycerol synthase domain-containing protein [Plantactinospora sp. B5E13]|uniref:lysylphosphatidylglycerol synthase domain-containing protein n=1 Tax=unclassified Plantactinospora TaxID=2631981 RepID=UPI00325F905A